MLMFTAFSGHCRKGVSLVCGKERKSVHWTSTTRSWMIDGFLLCVWSQSSSHPLKLTLFLVCQERTCKLTRCSEDVRSCIIVHSSPQSPNRWLTHGLALWQWGWPQFALNEKQDLLASLPHKTLLFLFDWARSMQHRILFSRPAESRYFDLFTQTRSRGLPKRADLPSRKRQHDHVQITLTRHMHSQTRSTAD